MPAFPSDVPCMKPSIARHLALMVLSLMLLGGCGFHLRRSAQLAPALQRLHLDIAGDTALQRQLATALRLSGVTLEDQGGPGIATLRIPENAFSTQALTLTGFARVSEYSLHYDVRFEVIGPDGGLLIPLQSIHMERSFTFDQTQVIGSAGQQQQIKRSLVDDMTQAILMRLQAQGHGAVAPSAATSTAGYR